MTSVVSSKTKRIEFLDGVRGLASFLVVIGHSFERGHLAAVTGQFDVNLGRVGVIAFFLVSGYVVGLSLDHQTVRTFWIRRFFRLYPIYWVCLALWVAVDWYIWSGGYSFGLKTVVFNLLMVQGFISVTSILWPTWTLGNELVFYAQQSILGRWIKPKLTVHIGWFWLAIFAVMCVATRFTSHSFSALAPLVLFTASVGLAVYLRDSRGSKVWIPFLIGFAVLVPILGGILQGLPKHSAEPLWTWTNFDLSYLVGGALFLAFYLLRRHAVPRILRWLGDRSYVLYLVHAIVILGLQRLGVDGIWILIITVPVSLAVSEVLHRFIEVKSQTFGRNLTRKLDAKAQAKGEKAAV